MLVIKLIMLALVFGTITMIGFKISNRYVIRANNLKQIKKALNIFEAKIIYTNETIPEVFLEISKKMNNEVGKLFYEASRRMKLEFAGEAWEKTIDGTGIILLNEDKEALKSLGKLLGSTDISGQINHLKLVNSFLDEQINDAVESRQKNEKMYKKLGIIIGLAVVIVLA